MFGIVSGRVNLQPENVTWFLKFSSFLHQNAIENSEIFSKRVQVLDLWIVFFGLVRGGMRYG